MILNQHIKKWIGKVFIIALAILILASCSSTKFVPENSYLLNKVELDVDNPEINKEEAKSFIRQKENYKILGFIKFYLLLYNMSSKKKTDDWLKRIGEAPQLYDEVMTERSKDQLKQYLDNKGYYRANITSELELKDKRKKAKLKFNIETGDRYTINNVRYHFATPKLQEIFMKDSINLRFRKGVPFDIYDLQKQQEKIVKLYRDQGYFYFSKNQVRYKADTTQQEKLVVLDLYVGETRNSQIDSVKILRPYYFNNFNYFIIPGSAPNLSSSSLETEFADTVEWDHAKLFLSPDIHYPANLFRRTTQMLSGDLYNTTDVENTFNGLNRLRQFRYVDIQFEEIGDSPYSNLLDCNVRLSPLNKQSISLDVEGTNTSGNLGVAGNIYYQHRNLFRGAEVFQIRLKGAVERMQRQVDNGSESFNTREFGIENSLTVPKLLGPGTFIRSFEKNLPKTVLNIGFNFQRRPEYTRTITNLKFGYDWKTSQNYSHTWNLMDVNFVHLFEFDRDFVNSIKDLYIKSSFTDHFIFAMNYSLIYNNQRLGVKGNYTYARLNIESAGNSLWALSEITGRTKYEDPNYETRLVEYYRYLGTPFAQYLKADIEVRRAVQIDQYNYVVGRAFFGVGYPYGNSQLLPFEKQYFAGGANGIRAWQVRSLGPGDYKAPDGFYPNQSSDLKLEANLEYRYKLIGKMEGALFLDAGNIWAINKSDNREGIRFRPDEFYKQIAVGTGTGFRFNLNYFILRIDLGMKLRDPAAESGKKWIIGNRKLTAGD
ncbi:MAG: BamA/TamA family outer membrane protein, partial [Bacteroidales bacterium]|nr:BamA/TamA family outer membrane protein [Bacteroidales bacterium]